MTDEEQFRANALLNAVQNQRDWILSEWGKCQLELEITKRDLHVMRERVQDLQIQLKLGPPKNVTLTAVGADMRVQETNQSNAALEIRDDPTRKSA